MQEATAELQADLADVNALLVQAGEELGNPLGELVQSQIRYAAPPLRAAFVLTAGYSHPNTASARHRRVLLAAALELLHVALNIHILLVNASLSSHNNGASTRGHTAEVTSEDGSQISFSGTQDEALDKTFIGSTILAGDYCFSRSAQFAARTDSPLVVERFAQALQTVSEANLRRIFGTIDSTSEGTRANAHSILRAGALCAVELSTMTNEAKTIAIELCTSFVRYLDNKLDKAQLIEQIESASLPVEHAKRWMSLLWWISETSQEAEQKPPT